MNHIDFLETLSDLDFFDALQIERKANARAAVIKLYQEYRMSPEQLHSIANEMAQRDANVDNATYRQNIEVIHANHIPNY